MIEELQEAVHAQNLSKIYALMEDITLDAEVLEELEEAMMMIATDTLHDQMAKQAQFDFENESERFVLRTLYDNALAKYESENFYDAKEAFKLLSVASNSKLFEKSLRKHLLALQEEVAFDDFISTWIDEEMPKHFFATKFTKDVEKKYKSEMKHLSELTKAYAKFFR